MATLFVRMKSLMAMVIRKSPSGFAGKLLSLYTDFEPVMLVAHMKDY
jgi:hypothetical protein